MGDAVGHRRVEDDGHPVGGMGHALAHLEALRRVHPGIQNDDPECRHGGAESHEKSRERVNPRGHPAGAKQHDAEKHRLEEERGQHLVGENRAGDVADALHEARPVGAELEAHGDARDHAHGKRQGEHLHPEEIGIHVGLVAGPVEAQPEPQEQPAKGDGDGREQDMKRDVGCKLNTGQQQGIHDRLLQFDQ